MSAPASGAGEDAGCGRAFGWLDAADMVDAAATRSRTTPNELWCVRNHHPVPRVEEAAFSLEVSGVGIVPRSLTLAELKAMPKTEVTATLQCGGNRRGGLDAVRLFLYHRRGSCRMNPTAIR